MANTTTSTTIRSFPSPSFAYSSSLSNFGMQSPLVTSRQHNNNNNNYYYSTKRRFFWFRLSPSLSCPRWSSPEWLLLLLVGFATLLFFLPFFVSQAMLDHGSRHFLLTTLSKNDSRSKVGIPSPLATLTQSQQQTAHFFTTTTTTTSIQTKKMTTKTTTTTSQQDNYNHTSNNNESILSVPIPLHPSSSSSSFSLSPLQAPLDYEQFTVRINTWKRPDQLRVSIDHYTTCPGVAQVQVVWCTAQGPPPTWLLEQQMIPQSATATEKNARNTTLHPATAFVNETIANNNNHYDASRRAPVVVELHDEENSLNERFRILTAPPTRGILSIDDDVLRPCVALDAGFFLWTQYPERLVGYDARTHVVEAVVVPNKKSNGGSNESASLPVTTTPSDSPQWKYGYLSTTERTNQYSLTLTRFCFVHVDYMHGYMTHMPARIRQRVLDVKNCEDIAMSLWVSSMAAELTNHADQESSTLSPEPPLLADYWAMKVLVKLYSPDTISGTSNHKKVRDDCLNDFAAELDLKKRNFRASEWLHHSNDTAARNDISYFQCGLRLPKPHRPPSHVSQRMLALEQQTKTWEASRHLLKQVMFDMAAQVGKSAFLQGLIQNTQPWAERFRDSMQGQTKRKKKQHEKLP